MYETIIQLLVFMSITCIFVYFLIKDEEEVIWAKTFFSPGRGGFLAKVREMEGRLAFLERFIKEAREAGTVISPIEYIIFCIISAAVAGIAAFMATNYFPMLLLGAACGFFVPHLYFRGKKEKRSKTLANQMSPFLQQMANYLRCGNSRLQAIEKLGPSLQEPLRGIMGDILARINAGDSMVSAFEQVNPDIPLFEFKMFTILIKVHSEVGGNLADSLDNLSNTIDEKKKLREAVDMITSETRISSYITAIIPTAIFLIFRLISPQYTEQLTGNEAGRIGLMVSFIFIGLGVYLTRRISAVKVDSFYS